jgi:hypothetical protein
MAAPKPSWPLMPLTSKLWPGPVPSFFIAA